MHDALGGTAFALRGVMTYKPAAPFLVASIAAFALVSFAAPRDARADVAIAGDLDYAVPIDEDPSSGGGFGVRLGNRFKVPLVALTPELGFTYDGFPGYAVYRGVGGLRLAVGEIIMPGVFAHLGVGRLSPDESRYGDPHTGFTFDAGAFIDFTLLPLINIGAHGAYNRLSGTDARDPFDFATFGLHAALIL